MSKEGPAWERALGGRAELMLLSGLVEPADVGCLIALWRAERP